MLSSTSGGDEMASGGMDGEEGANQGNGRGGSIEKQTLVVRDCGNGSITSQIIL